MTDTEQTVSVDSIEVDFNQEQAKSFGDAVVAKAQAEAELVKANTARAKAEARLADVKTEAINLDTEVATRALTAKEIAESRTFSAGNIVGAVLAAGAVAYVGMSVYGKYQQLQGQNLDILLAKQQLT